MPELNIVAKTTLKEMPFSCSQCSFGKIYGMVGDVKCRILDKYFTGNTKPPYKERADECPLVEWNTRAEPEARVLSPDELRKKVGKPVCILDESEMGNSGWVIWTAEHVDCWLDIPVVADLYGKEWFAYDRQPKGE